MRTTLVALAIAAIALPATAASRPLASKPTVISITVANGRPVGGIKRPTVKKGSTVRFVVKTTVGAEVHLHGYNIATPVRKGSPTVLQFVAKVPGRFELALHPSDVLLAQVTVQP